MGKSQRDKGCRFERECVNTAKEFNLDAKRVPLSGAVEGFKGDVIIEGLTYECKSRKDSPFTQLYKWLKGNCGLIITSDKKERLIVIPYKDYLELLEKIKIADHRIY
jgi:hypothetical protein